MKNTNGFNLDLLLQLGAQTRLDQIEAERAALVRQFPDLANGHQTHAASPVVPAKIRTTTTPPKLSDDARRERHTRVLKQFTPTRPTTLDKIDAADRRLVGQLFRYGFLAKKDDGYVRTDKHYPA